MFNPVQMLRVAIATSILILTGCSLFETKPAQPPAPEVTYQSQLTMPSVTLEANKLIKLEVPKTNPVSISFEKMSIKLDDVSKRDLAPLGPYSKTVSKIEVTGYCDQNQIANPSEAAVMRAVAVRDELIQNGADKNNILIKWKVSVRNKHAVEILFTK
jgi:outer membrane protein OmpA-like peptidoglycan-associated protein